MITLMILMFIFSLITFILILINLLISKKKINNREKLSPFECGFDPMNSSRLPFSIQYYLISIIFLIFDVEIVVFLPMLSSFVLNKFSSWMETSVVFIVILLIGLYIEWNDGALTWAK